MNLPPVHDTDDPWKKPSARCAACGAVHRRVWCHEQRKVWRWICNLGTGQSEDELADSLAHLGALGLMRFGRDEAGAIYYQVRADQPARLAALLDDHTRTCRN